MGNLPQWGCRPALPTKGTYMFKEFRDFALKGNVIDLAIGVIIGRMSEFFDFFVYGIGSVLVFPKLIFPFAPNAVAATLMSFAIFPLAFIARPVGSFIFMWIDRNYGRGTKLTVALVILGGSTASIGAARSTSCGSTARWPSAQSSPTGRSCRRSAAPSSRCSPRTAGG